METHLGKGRCPNIKDKQQEEIWGNIKTRNEGIERTRMGKKEGGGEMKHLYKEKATMGGYGRTGMEDGCAQDAHTKAMRKEHNGTTWQ